MRVKKGSDLRSVSDIEIKKDGRLRSAYIAVMKVNGVLRIVWQKIRGWVFTQGRPISVSGRMIRLNGQK